MAIHASSPPISLTPIPIDLEKDGVDVTPASLSDHDYASFSPAPASSPSSKPTSLIGRCNNYVESLAGLEARGITRVPSSARNPSSLLLYLQITFLWFSANLTANNIAVAFLGPLVFKLGFADSIACAVGGTVLGSAGTAYMGIWGAESGSRTMVVARFFMGYHPSKLCVLLNIIIMVGYGVIDCVIGGQILSAVSGGRMTIVVGIVIVAVISWVVAVFGMAVFYHYQRWAWIPQLVVLLVLVGSAGPKFDTNISSDGPPSVIAASRLSFFSLSLAVPISWAPAASDFYVYYPERTAKSLIFLLTFFGLFMSFCITNLLGIGLASAVAAGTQPSWTAAAEISSGALILAGYDGLAGFGKLCSVVIAFGVVANNIPGTYSAALNFQILGGPLLRVPRYAWTCLVVLVYVVLALAGRTSLFFIFENFLALMGYWVTVFICIVLEEHLLFKLWMGKGLGSREFEWDAWNDPQRLPLGGAALAAFVCGWAGAVLGMDQVWFRGPLAMLMGEPGGDLGI